MLDINASFKGVKTSARKTALTARTSNVLLVKQAQGTLDIRALLNRRQKIHLANRTWHRYLFEAEALNCV